MGRKLYARNDFCQFPKYRLVIGNVTYRGLLSNAWCTPIQISWRCVNCLRRIRKSEIETGLQN